MLTLGIPILGMDVNHSEWGDFRRSFFAGLLQ